MFSLGKELYTQCKTFRKYEKRFQNHILLYFLEFPDNILVYFLLGFFFFCLPIHKHLYLCIVFTYAIFIRSVTPHHL